MTYKQAKALKDQKDNDWNVYENSCADLSLEHQLKNAPIDIFNVNSIYRIAGMSVAECPKGIYEYPSGLMAWGGGIPEEAFLSQDDLEADYWKVKSIKDDFDW